jgi:hypothetical protein
MTTYTITWEIPDHMALSEVRTVLESLRGYGDPELHLDADDIPVRLTAEFGCDEEYTEFQLADDLHDTRDALASGGCYDFPLHPMKVEPEDVQP